MCRTHNKENTIKKKTYKAEMSTKHVNYIEVQAILTLSICMLTLTQ